MGLRDIMNRMLAEEARHEQEINARIDKLYPAPEPHVPEPTPITLTFQLEVAKQEDKAVKKPFSPSGRDHDRNDYHHQEIDNNGLSGGCNGGGCDGGEERSPRCDGPGNPPPGRGGPGW